MAATPTSGATGTSGAGRTADRAGLERATASFRHWSVLSGLAGPDFRKVAGLLKQKTFKAATQITPLGGRDTALYVLQSGRLLTRKSTDKYVDQRQKIATSGDIINAESFLTGQTNDFVIEALDNAVVWTITRDDWVKLLKDNPQIEQALVYPDPVKKHLGDSQRYPWLQPGEKLVLYVKKHWCVFVQGAGASWVTFLVLIVVNFGFHSLLDTRLIFLLWLTIGVLAFGNVVWQLIDWLNDYYALTDRRVIHRERVLFVLDFKEEAPLDKVQSVTVQQISIESSLFGVGDVIMTQAGSDSKVVFERIAHPGDVGKAIVAQQRRFKINDKAISREKIREDIRAAIEIKDRPADLPDALGIKTEKRQTPFGPVGRYEKWRKAQKEHGPFLGTALPRARLEVGDNIVYRKHWLQLLESIALPLVITLLFLALLVLFIVRVPNILASLQISPLVLVIPAMVGSALLVWLWYNYEDWRNDIYVVSKKAVIDIDRKPLGMSTLRRETTLDKVQAVTAKTRGFVDNLFNVGDVVIRTGSTDQLVFERVSDPQSVQAEISQRLDDFKRNAAEAEEKKHRAEFREWFHIYDEMARVLYDKQQRDQK